MTVYFLDTFTAPDGTPNEGRTPDVNLLGSEPWAPWSPGLDSLVIVGGRLRASPDTETMGRIRFPSPTFQGWRLTPPWSLEWQIQSPDAAGSFFFGGDTGWELRFDGVDQQPRLWLDFQVMGPAGAFDDRQILDLSVPGGDQLSRIFSPSFGGPPRLDPSTLHTFRVEAGTTRVQVRVDGVVRISAPWRAPDEIGGLVLMLRRAADGQAASLSSVKIEAARATPIPPPPPPPPPQPQPPVLRDAAGYEFAFYLDVRVNGESLAPWGTITGIDIVDETGALTMARGTDALAQVLTLTRDGSAPSPEASQPPIPSMTFPRYLQFRRNGRNIGGADVTCIDFVNTADVLVTGEVIEGIATIQLSAAPPAPPPPPPPFVGLADQFDGRNGTNPTLRDVDFPAGARWAQSGDRAVGSLIGGDWRTGAGVSRLRYTPDIVQTITAETIALSIDAYADEGNLWLQLESDNGDEIELFLDVWLAGGVEVQFVADIGGVRIFREHMTALWLSERISAALHLDGTNARLVVNGAVVVTAAIAGLPPDVQRITLHADDHVAPRRVRAVGVSLDQALATVVDSTDIGPPPARDPVLFRDTFTAPDGSSPTARDIDAPAATRWFDGSNSSLGAGVIMGGAWQTTQFQSYLLAYPRIATVASSVSLLLDVDAVEGSVQWGAGPWSLRVLVLGASAGIEWGPEEPAALTFGQRVRAVLHMDGADWRLLVNGAQAGVSVGATSRPREFGQLEILCQLHPVPRMVRDVGVFAGLSVAEATALSAI